MQHDTLIDQNASQAEASLRTTQDLVEIAFAGGGLDLRGFKHTPDEIVRIVTAASHGGGKVLIDGSQISIDDCVRIARASAGHVIFSFASK